MAAQWKQIVLAGDDLGVATGTSLALDTTLTVGEAAGTTGSILLKGTTSGVVTVKVKDIAGTWAMTLPDNDGTNGQVLATGGDGVCVWADAGGVTALDDIDDPDADTSISVAGYETLITSTLNEAAHTVLTITDTTADLTAAVTLLKLTYTDSGDADGTFLECLDNSSGDSQFKVGANGDVFLASGAKIDFAAGDITITHSSNVLTFAGATSIDLGQIEVLGLVLDTQSTAPNSGTEVVGQMYYDTDTDHAYLWCAA